MNQVKMIHFSNDSGSKEGVIFLELPDESNQDDLDYVPYGCTIDSVTVTDNDHGFFPGGFPFGWLLMRE